MSNFQQKTKDLEDMVKSINVKATKKCFPTLVALGIAVPIITFLALYFIQPSFVQKKDDTDGTVERDTTKVAYWTAFLSVIMWIALYLFTYCAGYSGKAMMCTFS